MGLASAYFLAVKDLARKLAAEFGCGIFAPARTRPRRLARPRTSPFHGGNTGSNPVGDANYFQRLTPIRSKTRGTSTVQVDFGRIMLTTLLCAARLAGVSA